MPNANPTIKANTVVSIDYTLRNDAGEVLDTSQGGERLLYLHGHQNIVSGLEKALSGKQAGDSLSVSVPPAEGYGELNPNAVITVPRSALPEDLDPKVGIMLAMENERGDVRPVIISEGAETTVTLDGNHELAGQTLHFEVTVHEVREANEEELAHGHVHGPGGAH